MATPKDCPMCGMPRDERSRDQFGEPNCWSYSAVLHGECPYERYEERAAIMEFDGGLSRKDAERGAALEVFGVA